MKIVLLSCKEKKRSLAPFLVCVLHKIAVAVGFLTQVLVSQNSSSISKVLVGLLRSFQEMQLSSLFACSFTAFLPWYYVSLSVSFSSKFHPSVSQGVGSKS